LLTSYCVCDYLFTFPFILKIDTGYDKVKKTIVPALLIDYFTLRRGLDWTLVETNKLISLAGLTILLLSFLPLALFQGSTLLIIAHSLITIHSFYSIYKFYGFSITRFLADKPIKKLSIFLGAIAQQILWAREFGLVSDSLLIFGGVAFSLAHFWTMEVDYKYQLQVRPFAYLPFALGGLAIIYRLMK
jgi:hypothetical protein